METQAVREINSVNFEELLNTNTKSVIDFWAPWCGPCRALAPTIEKLANDLGDQAVVAKLNIDDHPDIAAKYGISSIPTVIVFKGTQPVNTFVGIRPYEDYLNAAKF